MTEICDFDIDDPVNPKLKPARGLHFVRPRVCATCKHLVIFDGMAQCRRKNGFSGDAGDLYHWYNVCGRYTPEDE